VHGQHGWLAWIYWPGSRYRLLVDVAVVVIGALVAGYIFRLFLPIAATVGLMVYGTLGAILPYIVCAICFHAANARSVQTPRSAGLRLPPAVTLTAAAGTALR